ncbi:D-2-hydroxyacid dehydrogenase [Pelagibacterium lentulum]|uniref:2-hydroxyacid dehydrogenase n=1 Tax=Pelagibacterium lentulum TaxID=2029865 RepID=A0A916R6R8_9HYPH|nr:D-2-hydroxyacid dehydrogenase [Pelagibacterium lentulum]GGA40298.1 2-hydroxyacid dehydrogenase [Pelagibacterium lentulum]
MDDRATPLLSIGVIKPLDGDQRSRIEAAAPGARLTVFDTEDELDDRLSELDVLAGFLSEDRLPKAGKLKWLHSWMAGPDTQLYPAFAATDVAFTCSKGNGAVPLAEHAIMLMLMLNRNALRWIKAQQDHAWDRFTHGELSGLTVGIIGTGHSGQDLALKAKAFHMRVLGVRRQASGMKNFDAVYAQADIDAMLPLCDFVVVTAPLTAQTRDMLGEAQFRAMKPSAHYICLSRGGIANDLALLKALNEGWIAGAGLDAHSQEPLPAQSPFWTAPNTIITPHNGATSHKTPERGLDMFVDNLTRFVKGVELFNVVDKEQGY